ncbi:MAG TPA: manganese efflux pump MntP family protein [Bacteroidales bacterium]|nr:manganese efflux pump MntP family protein [Bacteroidales bacterium]HOK73957.1 manganese efflux pump MntP family protein [Bacteroidales bacterium]HOM40035.1 manganese efflux pump MntP family protein [Bacteroidales bacterium]HPP91780.1 manganese efflux pump MntP family protein [Bacteroidales bacterium]HRR15385.1 manganese efflux pump MntP family protein [Bacteroidales bacterium]
MDFVTILLIALGLSFDTFAASVVFGITCSRIVFAQAIRVAIVMALFQGGLTVTGYFAGTVVSGPLKLLDHWIALILLLVIGIRMIAGGIQKKQHLKPRDYTRTPELIAIALSTSIDAAAVGISFALLQARIWFSGAVIAIVTFLASMTAIRIGKSAGEKTGKYAEIMGGVILIGIGVKIFTEHLSGG